MRAIHRITSPFRRLHEFVPFLMVGASGVVVNLGVYYMCTRRMAVPIALASPAAIETALLWNFVLNDRWTFRSRRTGTPVANRLGRFHAVSLVAAAVNYGLLIALTALGWWDIAANLTGIVLGALAKFVVDSTWTWREPSLPSIEPRRIL